VCLVVCVVNILCFVMFCIIWCNMWCVLEMLEVNIRIHNTCVVWVVWSRSYAHSTVYCDAYLLFSSPYHINRHQEAANGPPQARISAHPHHLQHAQWWWRREQETAGRRQWRGWLWLVVNCFVLLVFSTIAAAFSTFRLHFGLC